MDYMFILPPCGLYQEFYDPDPESLLLPQKHINDPHILDANSMYWSYLLSPSVIHKTITALCSQFQKAENIPLFCKAVLSESEAFEERALEAKIKVADQGITEIVKSW